MRSALVIALIMLESTAYGWQFVVLGGSQTPTYKRFVSTLSSYTSIEAVENTKVIKDLGELSGYPWLFTTLKSPLKKPPLPSQLLRWLWDGGTLMVEGKLTTGDLRHLTQNLAVTTRQTGKWQVISPDHELGRSFYLLPGMPDCQGHIWREYRYENRMMILHAPPGLMSSVADSPTQSCFSSIPHEQKKRLMINLIMVILTTDYKKDQIHLPEILKRIR